MDTKLIQLRQITAAPLAICKISLEEAGGDLDKAIDLIKVKGQVLSGDKSGRSASEGRVSIKIETQSTFGVMCECNSNTDFVSNSKEFKDFIDIVINKLYEVSNQEAIFSTDLVEVARKELIAKTKENIIVRRWQIIQPLSNTYVYGYLHSNAKIGVLCTLQCENINHSDELRSLGEDLAMQICAMNPLAISPEQISPEDTVRQGLIFKTQLSEEKKPEKMWEKILSGKNKKWHQEVCLLNQESIVAPKLTIQQLLTNVGTKLGGTIQIINFTRYQVGEGIEVKKDNLAEEVSKLTNIQQPHTGHDPLSNIYYPDIKK